MTWILRVLKNRYVLLSLGLALGVGVVLALGIWLAWSWTVRLIGIIAVLVLFIVVIAVSFARANRSAAQIEQSIKQQAAQQLMGTRPDRRAKVAELQEQLERSIETLKQSKLGRGRRGKAALYALPWYLFIGPPGAGKTTAIANSGLHFPLGSDRVRGLGGTRNCDWFFSDQAILLDTAGRYVTEREDAEEWLTFLETLARHRSERPINGVLVGIALSDLAEATPHEVEDHADTIRRRIDELVKTLGVQFPVYLVFTKCDLLQGFVEFFGERTRQEREQIWGCTLEREQQMRSDLRALFDQEFERLAGALINQRNARLSRAMKRAERQQVYTFPLQFASMKGRLGPFVERLFQPNPYQESPVFRGFYFTSGTQEGVPIDRVIEAMARQFNLPTASVPGAMPETETKSYFIKDLFTDVVIPDQYMVRRTSKARRQSGFRRAGVTAAALAVLGLFILGTSQALVRGKMRLSRTEAAADSTRILHWSTARTADHLARMDRLHQHIDRLGHRSLLRPLLSLGLDRSAAVLEPTRRLYLDNARALVRTYPMDMLERRLRATASSTRPEGLVRDTLYADLKAYLLLTDEAHRLGEDDGNRAFLTRYLTGLTVDTLAPHLPGWTHEEASGRIQTLMASVVDDLRRNAGAAPGADERLVTRARALVAEQPSIAGVYNRLRLAGRDRLPPFTLDEALPGRARDLLSGPAEVSGFFTQRGWETFVQEAFARESKDPARDDWVMGRAGSTLPPEMQNREKMAEELKARYFSEYAAEWERFLSSVRVERFGGLSQAARAMEDLSNPYESPMAYLLARVTVETRFEPAAGAATPNDAPTSEEARHPVDRRFQWLHRLKADRAESGEAAPELYQSFESLGAVSSALDEMTDDGAVAAEYAARVLEDQGGALKAELEALRSALRTADPAVRRQLFEASVLQAWSAIAGAAQQRLNERWRADVYAPFQPLAGQYPFDPSSAQEAPLRDVEQYFNPEGGAVAVFLAEELAPYLGSDLRPRTWEGQGLALSPVARQAIERAQGISGSLFRGGVMRVPFSLQPDSPLTTGDAPAVGRICIDLVSREECYSMGVPPPPWPFEWPGRPGARLTVLTQDGTLGPRRYEGDWALFRMLQAARIAPRSEATYEVQWTFRPAAGYQVTPRFFLSTQSASNPFRDPRGFFSFQPPASLN